MDKKCKCGRDLNDKYFKTCGSNCYTNSNNKENIRIYCEIKNCFYKPISDGMWHCKHHMAKRKKLDQGDAAINEYLAT